MNWPPQRVVELHAHLALFGASGAASLIAHGLCAEMCGSFEGKPRAEERAVHQLSD